MKLEQSFDVDAPLATVWSALIDVQRVAPCLPGAEVTEAGDDGTYNGTFSVKLGPATASYRGSLKIDEVDEAAHRATMRANGTDRRGQGGAKATMVSTLTETASGSTHVEVETDFTITGRLASFSRGGMIQDISNRLLREFADCLQKTLAADQAAAAESPGVAETSAAGVPAAATPATPEAATPVESQPAAAPPKARPISGISLFFGALLDRLKRLFRRS